MNIFDEMPTFREWCRLNAYDPNNDEHFNNYCEWAQNECDSYAEEESK